jgi:hypothetical protein
MPTKSHPARAATVADNPVSLKMDSVSMANLLRLQTLYQEREGDRAAVGRSETIRRALRAALLLELELRANPSDDDDPATKEYLAIAVEGLHSGPHAVAESVCHRVELREELLRRKLSQKRRGRR